MPHMITFSQPLYWLLALLLVPILLAWNKRRPAIGHPHIHLYGKVAGTPWLARLAALVFSIAFLLVVAGVAGLKVPQTLVKVSHQSRDFVIGADISGSMWSAIQDQTPQQLAVVEADEADDADDTPPQAVPGAPVHPPLTRIRMGRYCIRQFVDSRQGDRVALIAFDDTTYFSWPLTFDLGLIKHKARRLGTKQGGGTNFDGPSDSDPRPGLFQSAVDHFHDLGQARTKVIIFVSDGDASISPKRHDDLVKLMHEPGQVIHIYAFIVGEKSQLTSPSTQSVRDLVHDVGGEVICAGDLNAMKAGFDHINQLEKSAVVVEKIQTSHEISQPLFYAALAVLGLFLLLAAVTRESP
ncbi:MAG TPA: vWA domain-containing protein [Trichormus sp.]